MITKKNGYMSKLTRQTEIKAQPSHHHGGKPSLIHTNAGMNVVESTEKDFVHNKVFANDLQV